ncbi:hypothetical protein AAFF_G00230860 [Aldrovandia affinis]|uniref:Dehydrogenase/reductase SDR family member 12 n=1 Tax=Aldrovandia affinis TaxID=143900 RepID=A0AAD7W3T4_9TELE|nr:hypothetical protein AAFF_G00230860 [Aldrovandia affinis]
MSFYRNAVWFAKGLREYTQSGYEAAAKHFVTGDLDVSLTGREFMITGANSGIGKATACEIAKRGGTVHLVCRNRERAEAARAEIVELSQNENVHIHLLDMSRPRQVWEFAQRFQETHGLHVLINNAGCMVHQRELTDEGLEKNFATNTLGVYILTTALIPALKKSHDPRVVTVSSGGMLVQKLNVGDLQFEKGAFDGIMAYAQNKRQQVILTERWASQHREIHFCCMLPGWVDTAAVRSSMPEFYEKMKSRLRTEAQGADTVVWLAASPSALKHPSGLFYQDRKAVATHLPLAASRSTPADEDQLQTALEELAQTKKKSKMSFYRNAVWFAKGLREYTQGGYEAAAKHFVTGDLDVSLTGREFMITGANSGIGKATACEIAKRGGTVHLVCRNRERAEAARAEIVELSQNENVHIHLLDMSRPRQVWEFAQRFQETHGLHVLINNAGCMVHQRELTEEGLEKNFATNTLGVYILTTALIPALKKSHDPRVVTVSSGGMLVQKLNVGDLQFEKGAFDGIMAYAQNKRQQVILTERWASQHREIHFCCMHPGWVDTAVLRSSMPEFYEKMKSRLRTEAQGADTVVWLAASPSALKHPSGLFYQDRKAVATHLPLAASRSTPTDEDQLQTALEELAQTYRP